MEHDQRLAHAVTLAAASLTASGTNINQGNEAANIKEVAARIRIAYKAVLAAETSIEADGAQVTVKR